MPLGLLRRLGAVSLLFTRNDLEVIYQERAGRTSPAPDHAPVMRRGKRLEVSDPHALAPTLILSHEINESSPLHGLTDAHLREADGAICVSVAAIDDHSLQASLVTFDHQWNSSTPCRYSLGYHHVQGTTCASSLMQDTQTTKDAGVLCSATVGRGPGPIAKYQQLVWVRAGSVCQDRV